MGRLNTGTSEGLLLSITKELLFATLDAEVSSVWVLQKILYNLKVNRKKKQNTAFLFLLSYMLNITCLRMMLTGTK